MSDGDNLTLALTAEEREALIGLLRRAIDEARYPYSRRYNPIKAILAQARPAGAGTRTVATAAARHGAEPWARKAEPVISLGTIIEALHDSEINGAVSWIYDDVWTVQLGDAVNEIVAEAVVGSAQEAAEWLRANAVRRYPHSEFARLYPRSANDP